MKKTLSRRTHQMGASLVELMVGLVIGLAMLTTVSQLYYSSGNLGQSSTDESGVQDNARLITSVIGKSIRQAGYNYDIFFPIAYVPVSGTTGSSLTIPDTINVQYSAMTSSETDCTGQTLGAGNIVSVNYLLQTSTVAGLTNTYILMCSNGTTSVEIARNVVNMKFYYGMDANQDGVLDGNFVDSNSAVFSSTLTTSTIMAVRMELTLVGEKKSTITKTSPSQYCTSFTDRNCTTFYNTFTLRNTAG